MQETLIIDGHVHVYPQFDSKSMIEAARRNFRISQHRSNNRDEAVKVWLLTERSDCAFFNHAPTRLEDFIVEPSGEPEALIVRDAGTREPLLYILAGRQIVTRERLEICALATLFFVGDGELSASEAVRAVNDAGGIAAVNWAPGKWFGARGRTVERLFNEFSPQQLLISDTTMRPTVWPTPRLMATAVKSGYRIVCGSDPLPFSGEEQMVARYAFLVQGDFDDGRPATSIRKILADAAHFTPCGRRSGLFQFVRRQSRIMREKNVPSLSCAAK